MRRENFAHTRNSEYLFDHLIRYDTSDPPELKRDCFGIFHRPLLDDELLDFFGPFSQQLFQLA